MALGISSTISLLTAVVYVLMTSFPANSSQKDVKTFVVTVRVFVDDLAFAKWTKLTGSSNQNRFTKEIMSLFVEANEHFTSFLRVTDGIIDFDVEEVKIGEPGWNLADYMQNLTRIQRNSKDKYYVTGEKRKPNMIDWNNVDLAVVFSGRKLSNGMKVDAALGSICTPSYNSTVTVPYSGSFDDVTYLVMGLGQLLGAPLVSRNSSDPCSGYIMDPSTRSIRDPSLSTKYKLSWCSVNSIIDILNPLFGTKENCVNQKRKLGPITRKVTAEIGSDILLQCSQQNTYNVWLLDGYRLIKSERYNHYRNGSLIMRDVTRDMTGSYACNFAHKQYDRFRVEINAPHFGQLVKREELCKRSNVNYFQDHSRKFLNNCKTFVCNGYAYDKGGKRYKKQMINLLVPTGYRCAYNKVCRLGKCVPKRVPNKTSVQWKSTTR